MRWRNSFSSISRRHHSSRICWSRENRLQPQYHRSIPRQPRSRKRCRKSLAGRKGVVIAVNQIGPRQLRVPARNRTARGTVRRAEVFEILPRWDRWPESRVLHLQRATRSGTARDRKQRFPSFPVVSRRTGVASRPGRLSTTASLCSTFVIRTTVAAKGPCPGASKPHHCRPGPVVSLFLKHLLLAVERDTRVKP